jgi:hypothetical protein
MLTRMPREREVTVYSVPQAAWASIAAPAGATAGISIFAQGGGFYASFGVILALMFGLAPLLTLFSLQKRPMLYVEEAGITFPRHGIFVPWESIDSVQSRLKGHFLIFRIRPGSGNRIPRNGPLLWGTSKRPVRAKISLSATICDTSLAEAVQIIATRGVSIDQPSKIIKELLRPDLVYLYSFAGIFSIEALQDSTDTLYLSHRIAYLVFLAGYATVMFLVRDQLRLAKILFVSICIAFLAWWIFAPHLSFATRAFDCWLVTVGLGTTLGTFRPNNDRV